MSGSTTKTIVTVDGLPVALAFNGSEELLIWQNGKAVKVTINVLQGQIGTAGENNFPNGASVNTIFMVINPPVVAVDGTLPAGLLDWQVYGNNGQLFYKIPGSA